MKITVVGAGYVGLSNAVLFAQRHEVKLLDISPEKTNLINRKISPIQDAEISEYLATKPLNLHATTHADEVYADAEYIIIATPTDYDPETNYFDTSSVESVRRVPGCNRAGLRRIVPQPDWYRRLQCARDKGCHVTLCFRGEIQAKR